MKSENMFSINFKCKQMYFKKYFILIKIYIKRVNKDYLF